MDIYLKEIMPTLALKRTTMDPICASSPVAVLNQWPMTCHYRAIQTKKLISYVI